MNELAQGSILHDMIGTRHLLIYQTVALPIEPLRSVYHVLFCVSLKSVVMFGEVFMYSVHLRTGDIYLPRTHYNPDLISVLEGLFDFM